MSTMWENLPITQRQYYKKLITNFSSLSEAFNQKSEKEDGEYLLKKVSPIVNSKFQETVFQKSFHAIGEDIKNTSYDASIIIDNSHKYLIGLKSFGYGSGKQKIAQFKSQQATSNWADIFSQIKRNAESTGNDKVKSDKINEPLYKYLATEISKLRNERIESSKATLKGFNYSEEINVEAVYHYLLPSVVGEKPQIFVGETPYYSIDIENIEIEKHGNGKFIPVNFNFTDGKHQYNYTMSDSQLYMYFDKTPIEEWDIHYISDPFEFFENLGDIIQNDNIKSATGTKSNREIVSSVSWMIANKNNEVEEGSGYNGFYGATKLQKGERSRRIDGIRNRFIAQISPESMNRIISDLNSILLGSWKTKIEKHERNLLRDDLINYIEELGNLNLLNAVSSLVLRPENEMYIPIPESKKYHMDNPDFFGSNIGTFEQGTSKLALPPEKRRFKLEFLQSGDIIEAYINQESGKAIQSVSNQGILGEWILHQVFRLKTREPLTYKRLVELEINAIRLTKFADADNHIGIEFIWIDMDNIPQDAVGWVTKIKKPE